MVTSINDLVLAAELLGRCWLLLRHDRWSRSRLETYQAQRLGWLRQHAYARSPFYKRFHAGLEEATLQTLPVLTKALLMEHFDDIVTDRGVRLQDVEHHLAMLRGDARFLNRYWVNATSGSTGRRGIFLFDRSEWVDFLASWIRGHTWTGYRLHPVGLRIALVASRAPWHMSARVGASFGRLVDVLRLDAGEPISELVTNLNTFQPRILLAYPSIVGSLADEQVAGRLHIDPELIFTAAEVLTDQTRERVEGAWGKRLFDQYGATESGGLAAECEQHQGLHLFEDRVVFEVVDANGRPVAPGVYGERQLITVLGSRTLPLIRYELDDSVRLKHALCPCGRPYTLVDGIRGKTHEVLSFPGLAGGRVAVNPIVFDRLMDVQPVQAWQVVQEADVLRVRVSQPSATFVSESLAHAVRQALSAQGVIVPPVSVEEVTAIPRGLSSKAALVSSAITVLEAADAALSR
jgi:putative adenylate-forming enzyme